MLLRFKVQDGKAVKYRLVLFLVVMQFAFSIPVMAVDWNKGPVLFSEDPWPPYTFGEEGMKPTGGMAVVLVEEVFRRLDIPIQMELCPWKRCLEQMKQGRRDALMLLGYSDERSAYLAYTDPVISVRDLIYFRRGLAKDWEKLDDFSGLKFGRTLGFQYGRDFEQFVMDGKIVVEEAKDDLANFRKLSVGRIDAFIANEITASLIFKENPDLKAQIVSAAKPMKEGPLYMGFSKYGEARDLVPHVNKVLGELRKEGFIGKIFLGE